MKKISLSMIIKNEERYLEGCLSSVFDVVDEIVIVDTGSTDKSLEIAKKYNAQIYHFDWIDDFAAARNFALSKTTGDWVLYLDADERVDPDSVDELKQVKILNDYLGIYCLVDSIIETGPASNEMKYVRLFRNHPDIKFVGKVHEQIADSLVKNNFTFADSSIKIIHLGYNVDLDEMNKKAQRNLDILIREYKEQPTSYNAFHLAQSYIALGEKTESKKYFNESLKDESLDIYHRAHSCRYLAALENEKNNLEKALKWGMKGLKLNPRQPLLHIVLSEIYFKLNLFSQAKDSFICGYKLNIQAIAENNSYFELKVLPEGLIFRGALLAIQLNDLTFLGIILSEANKLKLNKEQSLTLELIFQLMSKIDLKTEFLEQISEVNILITEEIIVSLIKEYPTEIQKKIIDSIGKGKIEKQKYYMFFAEYFEKLDIKIALNYYEKVFDLNSDKIEVGLKLVVLYLETEEIEKLKSLLSFIKNKFSSFPGILEKVKIIEKKLFNDNRRI